MIWIFTGCLVVAVGAFVWALCRIAALGDAGLNDWLELGDEDVVA